MDTARTGLFGVSPTHLSVGLACTLLFGAVAWNIYAEKAPRAAAPTPNDLAAQTSETVIDLSLLSDVAPEELSPMTPLGAAIVADSILSYEAASLDGLSPEEALASVQAYGESVRPQVEYRTYSSTDVKTDAESSAARVLAYRADLRVALEPLLLNKEYELDLFAMYVDTDDKQYLDALRAAAENYRKAIANTEAVVAPADGAIYHAAILNAMGEFAATLDAMVAHAEDPFASTALLKTFTGAQESMLISFNAIGAYAAQKTL